MRMVVLLFFQLWRMCVNMFNQPWRAYIEMSTQLWMGWIISRHTDSRIATPQWIPDPDRSCSKMWTTPTSFEKHLSAWGQNVLATYLLLLNSMIARSALIWTKCNGKLRQNTFLCFQKAFKFICHDLLFNKLLSIYHIMKQIHCNTESCIQLGTY